MFGIQEKAYIETVKYGLGSLKLWGFVAGVQGVLVKIVGIMDFSKYQNSSG